MICLILLFLNKKYCVLSSFFLLFISIIDNNQPVFFKTPSFLNSYNIYHLKAFKNYLYDFLNSIYLELQLINNLTNEKLFSINLLFQIWLLD
jgi:hypothetical protein